MIRKKPKFYNRITTRHARQNAVRALFLCNGAKYNKMLLAAIRSLQFLVKKLLTYILMYGIISLPLGGFFVVQKCPAQREILLSKVFRSGRTDGIPRGKERTKVMRVKITLACSECKQRNYDTTKNKKNDPDRIEINKYCRFCRKQTLHKETK